MISGVLKLTRVLCLAVANVLAILGVLATQPLGSQATAALVESAYVYVPPTAERSGPLQVVVAVHGLGGNGKTFGSQLIEQANHNAWVIVAPTIHYGNWWNVEELVREDTAFSQWLVGYLDNLQRDSGVVARERVLLFGFSRGAGVIGRFALLHPGRVLAGVALSSGAYTLPAALDENGHTLMFPFGVADLTAHSGRPFDAREFATTRWFVGVGESDNQSREVPQVWTPFIGSTRVERAKRFSASLRSAGANVTLRIFAETGHFLTPEMRNQSLSFLRGPEAVRSATGGTPGAGGPVILTPTPVAGSGGPVILTPTPVAGSGGPVILTPMPVSGGHATPTHRPVAATSGGVTPVAATSGGVTPAAAATPTVQASPRPSPAADHRPPVAVAGIPQSQPLASVEVTPAPHLAEADEVSQSQHPTQADQVTPPPHAAQTDDVSPSPHEVQTDDVSPSPHAAQTDDVSPSPHPAQTDDVSPSPHAAQANAGLSAPQAVPADGAPSAEPEAPSVAVPLTDAPTDSPPLPAPADEQISDPPLLPPA